MGVKIINIILGIILSLTLLRIVINGFAFCMYDVVILVVIFLIFLFKFYYKKYREHLDNALNGKTTKRLPGIYQIIICALILFFGISMIYMCSRIYKLNDQVSYLNSQLIQTNLRLQDIYSLCYTISENQKETECPFASFEWDYGEFHEDDYTADVTFTVIPKSVSEGANVTITDGKRTAKLSETNTGIFTGALPIDVFESNYSNSCDISVIIEQDGIKQTWIESCNFGYLWSEYLPTISYSIDWLDQSLTNASLNLKINVYSPSDNSSLIFESLKFVKAENGNITEETDLLNVPSSGDIAAELHIELDDIKLSYENGVEISMYVEGRTKSGFVIRNLAYKGTADHSTGTLVPDIYAPDGTHLINSGISDTVSIVE